MLDPHTPEIKMYRI